MPPALKIAKSKPKRTSKRLSSALVARDRRNNEQDVETSGEDFMAIKGIVGETVNSWDVSWANTHIAKPGPERRDTNQTTQTALDHWNTLKTNGGAIEASSGNWEKVEPFVEYDFKDFGFYLEQIFEIGMDNKEHTIKSIEDEAYLWAEGNTIPDPKIAMLEALIAIKEDTTDEYDDAELKYAIAPSSSFSTTALFAVKALESHPFNFGWNAADQAAKFYLDEAIDDDYLKLHQSCVALLLYAPHIAGGQSATSVLLALLISKEDAKDTLWGNGKEDVFGNWKSLCIRWFGQQLTARGVGEERVRALGGVMAALSALMRDRVRRAKLAVERE